jgi:AmmeMemoRadiSam system protein A
MALAQALRDQLTDIARQSIRHGLQNHAPLAVAAEDFPEALRAPRGTFVTLHKLGQLRGCIGSVTAQRPLVEDVAHNAFAAAFQDPRFPPLNDQEFPLLEIHISVLSEPVALEFASEQELLDQLRPGVDGLILRQGRHAGTFLPSVWEQLPEPATFLEHLKLKAGLPGHYWSDSLRVERYTTESW